MYRLIRQSFRSIYRHHRRRRSSTLYKRVAGLYRVSYYILVLPV